METSFKSASGGNVAVKPSTDAAGGEDIVMNLHQILQAEEALRHGGYTINI